ncbi:MAG: hypothetical protein DCC67_06270 [Planctomycetota bacterium]|nr:MAG: hypothetical protein DCC67_06270 [Planctomycetota bacterium]
MPPTEPSEPRLLPLQVAMPLSRQPCGASLRIVRLEADGDDCARLNALGVCVGRRLCVLRSGDPMIIRVVGARVGLSARLAAAVWVDSTPAAASHEAPHPAAPVRTAV